MLDDASTEAVDAVITWVDGADPGHRQRLHAYLKQSGHAGRAAAAPTRFSDCGEIQYCVTSLLRHAPWLRTIHILSDGQRPALMASLRATQFESRVRVVDHREIFTGFEAFLPTFSNRAIECVMWRIPGLAENFIYLNDDFQLLRPVAREDFFRAGGIVLRGRWRAAGALRLSARLKSTLGGGSKDTHSSRPGNHVAQERSARLAGFSDRYFQAPHVPHPMRRSVLARHFEAHPEQMAENVRHRLRSNEQFLTTALAAHLELAAGTATVDNRLQVLRLKADSQWLSTLGRQLRAADKDATMAFGCVQSLDLASEPARQLILAWLERRVGSLDAQ